MARKQSVIHRAKWKKAQTLLQQGQFEQAKVILHQLARSGAGDLDVWFTLGAINGRLGLPDEALECSRKVLAMNPQHVAAQYNLAIALRDTGQLEAAVDGFRQTLSLNPDYRQAMSNLGNVLVSLGRYEEAEQVFQTGLTSHDRDPEFYACLGSAMQTMGRYEAAASAYQKAIEYKSPEIAAVYDNLGSVFCQQGKYDKSLEYYRKALGERPDDARTHSNILLTMHYSSNWSEVEIFEEHRKWPGNRTVPSDVVSGLNRRGEDGRRIRLAYLSSDFREHSVAYFMEPVLEAHDRERFEIFCYHNSERSDAVTQRLRELVDHWAITDKMSDQQLFDRIVADEIDILVDLNGHTAGNRLPVFAMKPAPVQVNYLGYPNTTGLDAMDYRFTTIAADPEGADAICSETLWRLDTTFLCYRAPQAAPAVSPNPAQQSGKVTLGSFNNLAKINLDVIDLWAKLLLNMDGSRLMIKNPSLTDEATRDRYLQYFTARGISEDRIDLIGFIKTTAEHLELYSRIDIALDTFPYNGTTTTCEALWMGVPVITRAGQSHRARVGASLLAALGRPQWIANNNKEYLAAVQSLASDIPALAAERAGLRDVMRASPLCAGKRLVEEMESAYLKMRGAWLDSVA